MPSLRFSTVFRRGRWLRVLQSAIAIIMAVLVRSQQVHCGENAQFNLTMTGTEWISRCRVVTVITPEERANADYQTRLLLQDCSRDAAIVWCTEGYVFFSDEPDLPIPNALQGTVATMKTSCPDPFYQSKPVEYTLEYWRGRSLPFWAAWAPKGYIFSKAFENKWPDCLPLVKRLRHLRPAPNLAWCIDYHIPRWK
jgi:hypothetical protein